MEHLTYEDYLEYGGKSSVDDFPNLLLDAEQYLEKITFTRIDNYPLTPQVKRLLVKLMDDVLTVYSTLDPTVSSYSDGIESITYKTGISDSIKELSIMNEAYALCKLYLPDWLMYRGVRRI